MEDRNPLGSQGAPAPLPGKACPARTFRTPTVEVISLSCEVSAYAPDGDDFPLF